VTVTGSVGIVVGAAMGFLLGVAISEIDKWALRRQNRVKELEKRVGAQEERVGGLRDDLWKTQLYVEKLRRALAETAEEDGRGSNEDR
jgi:hypothetical protein